MTASTPGSVFAPIVVLDGEVPVERLAVAPVTVPSVIVIVSSGSGTRSP